MSSCINTCEIEGNELVHDILLCDSDIFMRFALGFSFFDQLISLLLLCDVMLDEILLLIILQSHSAIQNLSDFDSYFAK